MNLKNKQILITGGSGFIGVNLSRKLQTLEANVVNYDISNGQDILDKKELAKTIKHKFDVVYHLAGFSGSKESNENIVKSFEINTIATTNLLDRVSRYSPKTKIIFSSSRLEYGNPKYLPVDEKHPTVPTSAYGLSKLAATQMALIYANSKNLNVTIFRTSNVYGPHTRQKFKGYNLINYFIDLAKKNEVLKIFGNGEQLRDYIFIDDLIEAFILAASKNTYGEIYNLGYGRGIMIKDMASLIVKTVGSGRIKYLKWPPGYKSVETGSYISDIKKVTSKLGFRPKVKFEAGIKKTISKGP